QDPAPVPTVVVEPVVVPELVPPVVPLVAPVVVPVVEVELVPPPLVHAASERPPRPPSTERRVHARSVRSCRRNQSSMSGRFEAPGVPLRHPWWCAEVATRVVDSVRGVMDILVKVGPGLAGSTSVNSGPSVRSAARAVGLLTAMAAAGTAAR